MTSKPELSQEQQAANAELEQLVADVDRGGRTVGGVTGAVLFLGALCWSLFQLWYASPLPFTLNFAIFNDTEARALHLGIAVFLGYLAYPASKRSRRDMRAFRLLNRISLSVRNRLPRSKRSLLRRPPT